MEKIIDTYIIKHCLTEIHKNDWSPTRKELEKNIEREDSSEKRGATFKNIGVA